MIKKKKTSNSKGFKGDRLGDPLGDPLGDRLIITITRLFVLKKTPLQKRGCEVAGSNLRGAFGLKLCTDKAFKVVSVGHCNHENDEDCAYVPFCVVIKSRFCHLSRGF